MRNVYWRKACNLILFDSPYLWHDGRIMSNLLMRRNSWAYDNFINREGFRLDKDFPNRELQVIFRRYPK